MIIKVSFQVRDFTTSSVYLHFHLDRETRIAGLCPSSPVKYIDSVVHLVTGRPRVRKGGSRYEIPPYSYLL